ncbi:MAG TPA: adenosine deaminase [Ramlibacter sp.]|nr:adenosine deaminase [Ramlibacter sp.]
MTTDADFIRGLPKAELHLHIEGSLEPELMFELSRRNGIALPFKTVEEVRAAYAFSNLQDFLDIYYQGAGVLITEQDFHDLAMAYFRRVAADGCRHVELFFDPQTHTVRGIPFAVVADGLLAGMADARTSLGVSSKAILCFLRHLDEDAAFATLREAEPWLDRITAVGLDSSEVGHPPSKFARVYAAARARGLKLVAHAGEEGPPEYVWSALDVLKVERIDHGVQSTKDPALMKRLAQDRIPLTVCPLSNLKLCVFPNLEQHNLRELLDAGLAATVNSDDPAYFGGYMNANFLQTFAATGLDAQHAYRLARNSFEGSFAEPAQKRRYIGQLDAAFAAA